MAIQPPGGTAGGINDLYQDILIEHYKRPRHHQLLPDPELRSEGFNPFCGDRVVFTARLDGAGRISGVGFTGQGCAISQASASMMTDVLQGLTLEEVRGVVGRFRAMMQGKELTDREKDALKDLVVLEGVKQFPVRIKCALLAWSALQDALAEYNRCRNKTETSA
ncbi:MAG: Fe-S cluster assembly sulfur transfer protein SufU [Chloroflexota bacterium]